LWTAVAVALVVGLGALGWRVLRPAAAFDRSGAAYPAAPTPEPRRYGSLQSAPLIVDGRLRVYAEKRRVWADPDVTRKHPVNPYWSYRRWPGQLVAVVAVEPTPARPAPIVVARWSDGTVTGIDARAGRIAWEKRIAPTDPDGYTGRRTGADTVYRPRGLYTTVDTLVVDSVGGAAGGYDPWTGARRWTSPASCDGGTGWTTPTAYVSRCGDDLDIRTANTGARLGMWSGAEPTPWACAVGRSGCRMLTSGGANRRIGPDGAVADAPAAKPGTRFLVRDGYVESVRDTYVGVVDAVTGQSRWRVPLHGYVVGADDRLVYLVTTSHWLVGLDATTGWDRARVPLPAGRNWHAGLVHAAHGFVAVERLLGQPSDADGRYYYGMAPVALVGT
jgi:hypothetical protein